MSKEIKLEAGHWYRNKKGNIRRCAYIINHDSYRARFLMEWDDGSAGFVEEHEVGEHLPDCTGFDWEPPKPEPKYRPFANAEEFKPHRDKWWIKVDGLDERIYPPAYYNDEYHGGLSFEACLKFRQFEDGTPFGIREDS